MEETFSSSMPQELEMSKWLEEREAYNFLQEREAYYSKTTMEETSSSSMPQELEMSKWLEEREAYDSLQDYSKTTMEETSSSSMPQAVAFRMPDLLALSLDENLLASSCISTLVPTGLMIKYFVRVDNDGFNHIYPDLGGPYKSIEEALEAIDSHHVIHRKNLCMDGLSDEERAVRCALYWYHNGTRKHSQEAFDACTSNLPINELIKAVLDKYNEDSGIVGDLAYELEKVVSYNYCVDGDGCLYRSYYHFNLDMRTKGAEENNSLYFAEVTCMDGDGQYEAFVLTSISVVKPDDNGECHVCGADIKHPTHAGYNHGRPQVVRCGHHTPPAGYARALFEKLFAVHDENWLKEEEARVRHTIKEGLIKEGLKAEETSRNFEVDNKMGDHGKKHKYVIPANRGPGGSNGHPIRQAGSGGLRRRLI